MTVVIVNDFDYIQGGASNVALMTADILYKNNIKVVFFSAATRGEKKNYEIISSNQREFLKDSNKIGAVLRGIWNAKARLKFKKLLKTLDPTTTIIHFHGWTKALSSSVYDIAFQMKFPVVLTVHDYFTVCPNGGFFLYPEVKSCKLKPCSMKCLAKNCDSRSYKYKLYRFLRQFVQNKKVGLIKKLKYVISISDFSIEKVQPYLSKDIVIRRIYNPLLLEKKNRALVLKNRYFIFVGSLIKLKGIELFCQAVTELGYQGVVVGDGVLKDYLKKKYPQILFTGWKTPIEVQEYLQNAQAFIFPSLCYECAPLTIMEALSMGLPCVVSDECAAIEFVQHEKTGLYFKHNDLGDLKKQMKRLENNRDELENFSLNAYEKYWDNPYDSQLYFRHLHQYYNFILEDFNSRQN